MIRSRDLTSPGERSLSQAPRAPVTEGLPEFRAVYEANFDFVWRVLRRLGVREADTLDLVQKVFLTVHVRLEGFEGRSRLRTWIFGICQRIASDYRRSAHFQREVVTDVTELEDQRDETGGPLASAESREMASAAEAILDKLPEEQRIVFVLFELEELSGDDIAELLELPVGTVRSRLRLAREAVRREVARLSAMSKPATGKVALG